MTLTFHVPMGLCDFDSLKNRKMSWHGEIRPKIQIFPFNLYSV